MDIRCGLPSTPSVLKTPARGTSIRTRPKFPPSTTSALERARRRAHRGWRSRRVQQMPERDPAAAWSMPWDAPLVPEFPFTFRNVEVMTLAYRTRIEAVQALLPSPLQATSDWVLIHVYNMHDVEWL